MVPVRATLGLGVFALRPVLHTHLPLNLTLQDSLCPPLTIKLGVESDPIENRYSFRQLFRLMREEGSGTSRSAPLSSCTGCQEMS